MAKNPKITAKKKPKIVGGGNYRYNAATYKQEFDNWHDVKDVDSFVNLLEHRIEKQLDAGNKPTIVLDTETHHLGLPIDKLPEWIIRRFVKKIPQDVPFGIVVCDGQDSWFVRDDFGKLKGIIMSNEVDKIMANAKFDMHQLANIGMTVGGFIWDVIVMAKLTDENRFSFSVDDMSLAFNPEVKKWSTMKDVWLRENKTKDWSLVPRLLMKDYACSDGWYEYLIWKKELEVLEKEGLLELYLQEEKLIRVLFNAERRGFQIDKDYIFQLQTRFEKEVEQLEAKIYKMAGGKVFNINSNQQLYPILLKLGVDSDKIPQTSKGNICLDKHVMNNLAKEYDIAKQIVDMRHTEKLKGTYADGILAQLTSKNRVHGNFNQTEARTGRMSADQPNLQNIPKKDQTIRRAFIAKPDWVLLFYDYDQIEYKLFAHYCQDENLLAAIRRGWDIHRATAAILYNCAYEEVTDEQRSFGKNMNFGLIYGMGKDAIAAVLGLTVSEAAEFKYNYFNKLPKAQTFISTVQQVCKQRGYIKNFYGRRRRLLPDEAYKAPNSLIQGCAADVMKKRMCIVADYLEDFRAGIISVVHDELIIEAPINEVEFIAPAIKMLMTDKDSFRVPMTVGCDFSLTNWADKVPYDFDVPFAEQVKEVMSSV